MLRILKYLFIAVILCLQVISPLIGRHGNSISSPKEENRQYPAYIFVHNRSAYPVIVTFNGNQVGSLGPGQYYTWTVAANYAYHVRTYWQNGNYNYWNASLGPHQTYRCLTGY